jgi:ribosome-associated protein
MNIPVHKRPLLRELKFTAVKSSGAGGQNVNKVSTKVELRFTIKDSSCLSENEKAILCAKLAGRTNSEGELIISSQEERSQLRNKQRVIEKFLDILHNALKQKKKRIATRASKASKLKRMDEKHKHSEKKELRKRLH